MEEGWVAASVVEDSLEDSQVEGSPVDDSPAEVGSTLLAEEGSLRLEVADSRFAEKGVLLPLGEVVQELLLLVAEDMEYQKTR